MSNTTKAKVIFLGDLGVGKTSIIMKQERRSFDPQCSATIGVHFVISTVQIASEYVQFQIWDTGGQERFRSMVPMYLRNAKAAFLVYDITDRNSFENIPTWVEDIERWILDPLEIIILANKADLTGARQVTKQEGLELATKLNCKFYETSAKNEVEIKASFAYVAEQILLKNHNLDIIQPPIVEVTDPEKKDRTCCWK